MGNPRRWAKRMATPRRRPVRRLTIVAAASSLGVVISSFAAPLAAHASPARSPVPHSRPGWLTHARDLGRAPATAAVQARIYLAPNGGLDALAARALAVSTPGSADYGHFLSPAEYFAEFGTTDATVRAVTRWLTSSGLTVTGVEAHNRYLDITGSVAAAERAFGVHIHAYSHDGQTVQAPDDTLTTPADLADDVLAVDGIDTTPNIVRPALAAGAVPYRGAPIPPPAGFRNAAPCSSYYGEKLATDLPSFNGQALPYAVCGYVGAQFRSAYEGATTLDGTGITVGITDAYASPTIAADAATYAVRNGDRPYAPGQLTQSLPRTFTNTKLCDASGWFGEETLDVEAVHAMAQGAKIRYYASSSCLDRDLLDAFARINDEARVQIVSNSWGAVEQSEHRSTILAYEQAFLQGAVEGISYVFSSGDSGDEVASSGTKQTDYPASDPFVTAVGGTATAIDATGRLAWETGWGTYRYALAPDGTAWSSSGTFLYGSGGGESTVFAQPIYQQGITPAGARGVPDVAMDADVTTGMLVGQTQAFPDGTYYDQYRIGGTSLAAPLFAGMTALTFQHARGGVGLLNPTIYRNAGTGVFTDVTGPGPDPGNVRVDYADGVDAAQGVVATVRTFNQDSSLAVGPGWDPVTGLGSANAGWLTAIPPRARR
ncbi:physarolisin II [Acidothermus cellulolyticus 11B]|uniref:Physarolisin II n=2 Tax=Acidothermus cellulolyticus TaxID=28049 RepID=A0LVH5_ACIC1|nr:physarolisin II [Acidothermus cellulolyticus 11B]